MASKPVASAVQIETETGLYQSRIVLNGYNEFKKLLKDFDPALRKAMDAEIRGFLKPVAQHAKTMVPSTVMRNWRKPKHPRRDARGHPSRWSERAWDQSDVVRGIVVRQGGKRRKGSAESTVWKIQNKSAAGAIYETAGKRSGGHSPAGVAFVSAITLRGGRPSRLIWRAWDQAGGDEKITKNVIGIISRYENELQDRMDAAGED